jgi:type VI secretion system protein ImpM
VADVASSTPGWYGKIPSVGDFASRRLPQHFIDVWHDWLQQGMAASRTFLGDGWLNQYLNSPIWRFLLTPGVCGASMWAGTLMPSVDKVGRYFPLTLAVQVEARTHSVATVTAASDWYAALERLSLAMLDINVSVDDLEHGLIGTPFPAPDDSLIEVAQEFIQWWVNEKITATVVDLSQPDAVNELVQIAAWQGLTAKGPGKSLWWTSDHPKLHCFVGLPPARYFSVLLENRSTK